MKKLFGWIVAIIIILQLPKACSPYNGNFEHDVRRVAKELREGGYTQKNINNIDDELRYAGYEDEGDRSRIMTEAYHMLRDSE